MIPLIFKDSDGDGIGDFKGITSKLDHFVDLGTETIHMTPMFETTARDMGYDITDYYKVDHRLGTMSDLEELISEMNKRNMKLVLDLVINHSGHEHAWFQKSIDRIDPYTDFYVWKDSKGFDNETNKEIPPNNWTQDHDRWRVGSRILPEYGDIFTMISMMLPGTVGVYYGQEINMVNGFVTEEQIKDFSGEGLRDPNRLLMQWDDSMNAGFSTNVTTYSPVNSDYFQRNVEMQKIQPVETTASVRVNLTKILKNGHDEITIVAASVNSGYMKGFNIEHESREEFYMRPSTSVVLETYQTHTEDEG
ncbi:alpha-glucosidase-like [Planococcus citri]|uniref:alpha-glucosidase-like n=1 Tax=Planococcus citri TaxID=170843 RepID=UPI0031FA0104